MRGVQSLGHLVESPSGLPQLSSGMGLHALREISIGHLATRLRDGQDGAAQPGGEDEGQAHTPGHAQEECGDAGDRHPPDHG